MSWLCRQCETVNTDDVIECEVCDAVSPYLSRFDYDEITPSKPTTIRWKAEECDCIKLHYRGHITDVSHLNSVRILANRDTEITFVMSNNVAEREYTYDIREHKPPITRLRFLTHSDETFVKELCSDKDFKKYLTLGKYGDDIDSFFKQTMDYFKRGLAFPYVIETMDSEPVGMITCQIEQENNLTIGYVTYAVLPDYRNYGLASEALMNMRKETKEAGVESVVLFISTENKASRRVAEKCGFKCKDEQLFFADEEGISIMLPWKYVFSEHISKREVMVKKALEAFKKEECDKALRLFENSLRFKCPRRCTYSDGIIYSYIGDVYTYQHQLEKAYDAYKKALSLGCSDDRINKQIKWLESNMYSL